MSGVESVDIDPIDPESATIDAVAVRLCDEAIAGEERTVAWRGSDRLVQEFGRVALPAADTGRARLRTGGIYLITGGLGGLGLALAEHLIKKHQARIVLTGRTPLPGRERWPALMDGADTDARLRFRIASLLELEAAGGHVLTICKDVTNADHMRDAVSLSKERFGALHGVFHTAGTLDDGLIALKKVLLQGLGSRARIRWVDLVTRPIRTPCGSAASARPRRPSPSIAPVPCGAHA